MLPAAEAFRTIVRWGEDGSHAPSSMINPEVTMSCQLARLWMNRILLMRMTCMIRVSVSNYSTNHPTRELCDQYFVGL